MRAAYPFLPPRPEEDISPQTLLRNTSPTMPPFSGPSVE
jgi:hypothetical protein